MRSAPLKSQDVEQPAPLEYCGHDSVSAISSNDLRICLDKLTRRVATKLYITVAYPDIYLLDSHIFNRLVSFQPYLHRALRAWLSLYQKLNPRVLRRPHQQLKWHMATSTYYILTPLKLQGVPHCPKTCRYPDTWKIFDAKLSGPDPNRDRVHRWSTYRSSLA